MTIEQEMLASFGREGLSVECAEVGELRVRLPGGNQTISGQTRNGAIMSNRDKRQERGQEKPTEQVPSDAADKILHNGELMEEATDTLNPQARPVANIPKALHHLRKATSALTLGDLTRDALTAYARTLVHESTDGHQEVGRWLGTHAQTLEFDHAATSAAADVRKAIEALG